MLNFVRWVKLYFEGGEEMVAMLFVQRIINGKNTYKDVPKLLKEQVAEILRESNLEELIVE